MQHFAANFIVDLPKIELRLTLIAQDLEHVRPALFRHADMLTVDLHDMHLERLNLKLLLVPTTWAGQPHYFMTPLGSHVVDEPKKRLYGMPSEGRNSHHILQRRAPAGNGLRHCYRMKAGDPSTQ